MKSEKILLLDVHVEGMEERLVCSDLIDFSKSVNEWLFTTILRVNQLF